MSENIKRAISFATEKHKNQFRKYTNEPYITHPISVMNIVNRVSSDENMLIAAILHDTVEDTNTTIDEIKLLFGEDVAKLVFFLTKKSTKEDGNRSKRKSIDREFLKNACIRSKTIKIADIIHNLQSVETNDKDFSKVYFKEKRELLPILKDGNEILYKELELIILNYFNK